jgi:Zn-dependent oligopeptidase
MRDITFQTENAQDLFIRVLDGVAKVQQDLTMLPVASTQALQDVTEDYGESTQMSNLKKEICRQISALPSINILNQGHFNYYGGSYYSYLFAKMYAAQIWHQNLAQDPLNP